LKNALLVFKALIKLESRPTSHNGLKMRGRSTLATAERNVILRVKGASIDE